MTDGPVTIMFTDLEGSTALRTTLGDAHADEPFARHGALVLEQIAAHGGRDQGAALGDGYLAVFTSTRRALACAVAIQDALDAFNRSSTDPRLRVRIGLNTGEVSWQQDQPSGEAVHGAARVCAAAVGGQILVADVTRQLAGTVPGVTFRDAGEFTLKGFPDPWRLWEVVWSRATSVTPASVFVGRDAELGTLRAHLHDALDGRGGLVLVGGEPGVGKTTLVRQLIREAERCGALTVFGRCYEAEGAIPYAPFVEMLEQALAMMPPDIVREDMGDDAAEVARMVPELRRRFPDIPEPLDLPPEQQRRFFFNALGSFVARGSARFPLVMAIDDIHWADEPTLLLTEHMASLMPELRVLGIGTYRDVELDVSRPLAGTVDRLVRARLVERLPVQRFDRRTVAAMIGRLAGMDPPDVVVDAVYSETEGNPFFVEEVYRHLVEEGQMFDADGAFRTDLELDELEVPESVRLVIGRRLARLGPDVQRILAAGSVVGRGFPFRLLERIVDTDASALLDAVEAAEAAQVVVAEERDGDVHYAFGHELIRQTLLSGLSVVRRQRLHLAVADAIEATDPDARRQRPSEIAGHLLLAGGGADRARTLEVLELAADRAIEAAAYEEALRTIDSAVNLADGGDRLGLARLNERRGQALRALGQFDECIRLWMGVVEVFAQEGLTEEAAELCAEAAYQNIWLNRFEEAFATIAHGLDIVGGEPTSLRARLLSLSGSLLGLAGSWEPADHQLTEAEGIALQIHDDRALGVALWARSLAEWVTLRTRASIESSRRSIEALTRANDQWALVDAMAWASYPRTLRATPEDTAEGRRLADQTVELARRLGHRGGEALGARAMVLGSDVWAGDLDAFERAGLRDLETFSAIDSPWVSQSYTLVAHARVLRGDLEGALGPARSAMDLEPVSAFSGPGWSTLALVHAWRGELDTSRQLLDAHLRALPPAGERPTLGGFGGMMTAVDACAVLGLQVEAAAMYPLMVPWLDEMSMSGWDLTLAERSAAMAAAAGRRWEDAERLFDIALERAAAMQHVVEQARVRQWYGEMLLDRAGPDDLERAHGLLGTALESHQRLGMVLYAARARARLQEGRTAAGTP